MSSYFMEDGTRQIDIKVSKPTISKLSAEWQEHLKEIPSYPEGEYKGRGIVMCAGGLRYFTCGYITIRLLREKGCTLPIEVWYYGNELSDEAIATLETFKVSCKNFLDYPRPASAKSGFVLKPLSILNSSFKEVFFLDADNICLEDPEQIFEWQPYKDCGAVFWPDFWKTPESNPIWEVTGLPYVEGPEQESGQLLIDKERCWEALNLCYYFNKCHYYYYEILLGDKDTFRFAWLALKKPFHMVEHGVSSLGYYALGNKFRGMTMVQHDLYGKPLFLHRNLLKWDITRANEKVWETIKQFKPDALNKGFSISAECGHAFMDLTGEVMEISFIESFGDLEQECLDMLNELRESAMYQRFVTYSHFVIFRFNKEQSFTLTV